MIASIPAITHRIHVAELRHGMVVAERNVRGEVVRVTRTPGLDVLCEVMLSTGVVKLWHPMRRVGVVVGH
jgi:hypothetical protein